MGHSLDHLNQAQKSAVTETEGAVMVLAGAGSGKTRTLVARICHLVDEMSVSPYQILALTFSNKAAREMKERVESEAKIVQNSLQITTFHSFCAYFLRREFQYLGLGRNFTIYDGNDAKALAKTILSNHKINPKDISHYEILGLIEELKNQGYYLGREQAEGEEGRWESFFKDPFFKYFREYELEMAKANAVDFGGLITNTIKLLKNYPDVQERYQNKYQYLLVDEYQDTNRAQFELLLSLIGKKQNICVVGDEDQSIYSWRGADIQNILDFEKFFPQVKLIKLEQNYRSTQNIINAASKVIAINGLRSDKLMWTENEVGEDIAVVEAESDMLEGQFIAHEITRLQKSGVSYKDMAIFYRNNAQSRIIEEYLRSSRINYRVIGGVKFYDRKEIRDVIAYLKLIINEKDSLSLSRVINVPPRGIGAVTMRKLEDVAQNRNISLWEVINSLFSENGANSDLATIRSEFSISNKVLTAFREFYELITQLKEMDRTNLAPSLIFERLLAESGIEDFYKGKKDVESLARLDNLEEFKSGLIQYEGAMKDANLRGFLEKISLDTTLESEEEASTKDQDPKEEQGHVSLMTIHGAKGLEFFYVFVLGAEENIFPSFQSVSKGHRHIEEERRLFYVAMTRAMKKLYICFATARMLYGSVRFNGPSRFILEIPQEYYHWQKIKQGYIPNGNKKNDKQSTKTDGITQELMALKKFPVGTRLKHALYGKGTVVQSEGHGKDEKIVIDFNHGMKKKFMVKFAPLEIL